MNDHVVENCWHWAQGRGGNFKKDWHPKSKWISLWSLDVYLQVLWVGMSFHPNITQTQGGTAAILGNTWCYHLANPKEPNKHILAAAHSIKVSWESEDGSQTCLSLRRMPGVIGRCFLVGCFVNRLIPFIKYSSLGILPIPGSPKPSEIWACLTAAK